MPEEPACATPNSRMPVPAAPAAAGRPWAVLAIGLLAPLALSLPYLYGWLRTPAGWQFAWHPAYSPADSNTYLAWMRQAAAGRLLFSDAYTTEPQHIRLFLPLFLLLGRLAGWLGLPLEAVTHAARLALGAALLLAGYRLARAFLDRRTALIALALMAFSSGCGAILSALTGRLVTTADLWAPEGFVPASILTVPHFVAGTLLLAVALGGAYAAVTREDLRLAAGAGLAGALLALVHPFDLAAAWVVPGVYQLAAGIRRRRALACCAIYLACSLPGVLYLLWTTHADPIWRALSREVLVPPGLQWYLGGYGLLLLYAVAGIVADARRRDRARLFPAVWWLAGTAILFAPVLRQRARCIEGLHLPLCILAAHGIVVLEAYLLRRRQGSGEGEPPAGKRRVSYAATLVLLTLPSTFGVLAYSCRTYQEPQMPFYVPVPLVAAGNWLRANAPAGSHVFASEVSGNYLPSAAVVRVYLGHYHQTLGYRRKLKTVEAFYSVGGMEDAGRQSLLRENRIRYVLYGPYERDQGAYDPESAPYLSRVFAAGSGRDEVAIYRVSLPPLAPLAPARRTP